jgi:hypothetical protein
MPRQLPMRERIFATVEQLLQALPDIASVRRMASGDADSFPDVTIDDGGEIILGQSVYGTQARISLNLIGQVSQPELVDADLDAGSETHRLMNMLDARLREVMFSNASLNGLAQQLTLGELTTQVSVGAAQRHIAFSRTYFVDYNSLTTEADTITDL